MKIFFAIKSMCSVRGGAERVLADISSTLAQNNTVSLLTFDADNKTPVYPINKSINKIFLGLGDTRSSSTIFETIRRIFAIRQTIKNAKPDVVIAFMHSMFIPLSFALIGTGIPVIASEHIVPEHYKKRKIEFILLCLSSLFVKKITVLSESVKQTYPSFLHSKMVVFTNPVLQAVKIKTNYDEGINKCILSVGRLSEQKNHKLLIEAFVNISDKYPGWSLKIIGEGELRPALETQIAQHNLQDRIKLAGTTDHIEEEYLQADIFAMPSNYESFGLALVEAMGHGLPVLGFADCQGVNELIRNNENGLLIQKTDKQTNLSKGLETLMQSAEMRERFGKEGIKTSQKFSPDKIGAIWEKQIKEILLSRKN